MQPNLYATGLRQGGVFTTSQARAAGYTPDELRVLIRTGRWERLRRGIYSDPAWGVPAYRLATAAVLLACARSRPAASHRCAARLLGLPLLDEPRLPEITVPESCRLTAVRRARLHHASVAATETVLHGSLRLTTPARTVVDLARELDFRAAVVTADAALHSCAVTAAELGRHAQAFQGRPGSAALRRVLDFASAGSASVGESVARIMFAEQGLPAPALGQPIRVAGTVIAEVDFLWAEQRTVGEFDGRVKYGSESDRGDDTLWQEKLREERLREAGFEVVRMTWDQVTREPSRTAERVRAAFARRAVHAPGP